MGSNPIQALISQLLKVVCVSLTVMINYKFTVHLLDVAQFELVFGNLIFRAWDQS